MQNQKVDKEFHAHVELIVKQDFVSLAQARFTARCEGPDGHKRRLEKEQR